MPQEELTQLVIRCQNSDTQAMELLMEHIQRDIYYMCLKFLHHPENAQDAAQDILIKIFEKLGTLEEPAAFRKWMNRMTANHCKNLLVKREEFQIPEDEEGNSLLDSLETLDEQIVPDQAIDRAETRSMILELVDALPAPQRMSVILYYYNEMPVREIAQAMDVSENTVKSRLNYARKSIEAGVREHEKKGVKLYSVSPVLLLSFFLRREAEEMLLPALALPASASGSAAASAAARSAAGTAGKAAASAKTGALAAKLGAVVLAAGITVGAISVYHHQSEGTVPPTEAGQGSVEDGRTESCELLLHMLDRESWATYARLFDFNEDGISECLFLAEPGGSFAVIDGNAWQTGEELWIIKDISNHVGEELNFPSRYLILRDEESGQVFRCSEFLFSEPIFTTPDSPLYDDGHDFIEAYVTESWLESIYPLSSRRPIHQDIRVYQDGRDHRSRESMADYEAAMGHLTQLAALDFSDPRYTPQAVREELNTMK